MAAGGGSRAVVTAMAANGGIAVAKFIAFLVTGSASMLAESIHSVADTSNQGLLLLGGKRAKRIEDDEHQFGYGRERYFWSFVVAMVLFALGGVFSIYEGIQKILHPHELESIGWAIGVLLFAVALEGYAFSVAAREAKKTKGDQSWWQFIRNARSPELPVILLEDAGAQIGLLFALSGVGLYAITGNEVWDGIGTLCIGILLVSISIILTIEMQSLLVGEAATEKNVQAMTAAVRAAEPVERIIDLRTQHIGPEELLVAGKIEFRRPMTGTELTEAIDVVEAAIRDAVPIATRIYLEPDVFERDYDDDYLPPTTDTDTH